MGEAWLWSLAVALSGWSVIGWLAWRHPLEPAWLWILAVTQAAMLWVIPFGLWIGKKTSLEDLARELDRAWPAAPDPFRLSLGEPALDLDDKSALEDLLSPWVGKSVLPRRPPLRLSVKAASLAGIGLFAGMAVYVANPWAFFARTLFPLHALASMPRVDFIWPKSEFLLAEGDSLHLAIGVPGASEGQVLHALLQCEDQPTLRFPLIAGQEKIRFDYGPIRQSARVRVSAANGESEWKKIKVVSPPVLSQVRIEVRPPAYTGLPNRQMPEGILSGSAPEGSQLIWHLHAKGMRRLSWINRASNRTEWDTTLSRDSLTLERRLAQAFHYALRLCDADGFCSVNPPTHFWKPIPDSPPRVEILSPRPAENLSLEKQLPVMLQLLDDYGFSDLRLHWRLPGAGGSFAAKSWLSHVVQGNLIGQWDLRALPVQPGQTLEIRAEAFDNRRPAAQNAFSEWVALRMPLATEVVEAIQGGERQALDRLRSASDRNEKTERKWEEAAQDKTRDGPSMLQAYDMDRIMVQEPESHLLRLASALKNENSPLDQEKQKGAHSDRGREEIAAALRENLANLPRMGQSLLPLENQLRNLEKLRDSQKKLAGQLEKQEKALGKPEKDESQRSKSEWKALTEDIKRRLDDQKDLAAYLQDRIKEREAREKQLDAALDEHRQMLEDIQAASKSMEKSVEQSKENGLASPELLRKMEKLQEMLRDLLPDSLQALLRKQSEGQDIDLEAVKNQLQEVLENRAEFEQGLDRALGMLEALQDRRALESLRDQTAALAGKQKELADSAQSPGLDKNLRTGLAEKQNELRKQWRDIQKEFKQESAASPRLKPVGKLLAANRADSAMASSAASLGQASAPSEGEGNQGAPEKSAQAAAQAAESLAALKGALDGMLEKEEKAPTLDKLKLQALIQQSLELSHLQVLNRGDAGSRRLEGWVSDRSDLYGSISRAARHLETEAKQLLRGFEAGGQLVLKEAHILSSVSEGLFPDYTEAGVEEALRANHRLTRELLRLNRLLNRAGGGGMGAMAGGEGQEGEGEGEGQGQGAGLGPGQVGQALQGVSGQQMAVNQATYQLLKAMLEGRSQAPGTEGMASGGAGARQRDGAGKSQGGEETPGAGGLSGKGALGNQQGNVGEGLEAMADKAEEIGGGASRLRQLAAEARELEQEIRRGRLDPEGMKQKQDRFRMRLLEASRALQERGREEKRESRSFQGRLTGVSPEGTSQDDLGRRIEAARKKAKSLPLGDREREELDNFYRELLTP